MLRNAHQRCRLHRSAMHRSHSTGLDPVFQSFSSATAACPGRMTIAACTRAHVLVAQDLAVNGESFIVLIEKNYRKFYQFGSIDIPAL